jgi:UDP-glucose 4-epimerase
VREVIKAVERVNGAALPVKYGPRRAGDPAAIVAGAERVRKVLGWQPRYENLDFIVETAFDWERKLAQRNDG